MVCKQQDSGLTEKGSRHSFLLLGLNMLGKNKLGQQLTDEHGLKDMCKAETDGEKR